MAKKNLILVLLISILAIFTSCGLDYRCNLDEEFHNKIEFIWNEKDPSYIIYLDDKYVFVGTTNFFNVDTYEVDVNYYKSFEDDILLSWNGYRYIGYIDEYYSYTVDNPIFIYNDRLHWVFFNENYNYLTDVFVIENTGAEIVWEDIFYCKQNSFDFVNPIKISLNSKQYPRIKTYLELVCLENNWYRNTEGRFWEHRGTVLLC